MLKNKKDDDKKSFYGIISFNKEVSGLEQKNGVYEGSARLRESDVEGKKVAASQFQIDIEFDSGKTLSVKTSATYSVEGAFENLDLSNYEEDSIQKVTVVKIG